LELHRISAKEKPTDKVEEGQPWDEFEVELAEELLVLRAVSNAARLRNRAWTRTAAARSSSLSPASGSGMSTSGFTTSC
jgi:hypothetical protein